MSIQNQVRLVFVCATVCFFRFMLLSPNVQLVFVVLCFLCCCLFSLQAHAKAFQTLRQVSEPFGTLAARWGYGLRQNHSVSTLLYAFATPVRNVLGRRPRLDPFTDLSHQLNFLLLSYSLIIRPTLFFYALLLVIVFVFSATGCTW